MSARTFRTETGRLVPAVSAAEMGEVDRVAVEEVGLALLQMMENAGRALASRVIARTDGTVLVAAGNGGNGGGGLACARHLANHEVDVEVVLDRPPEELTGEAAKQHRIIEAMGVPTHVGPERLEGARSHGAAVDALIGYGLAGDVREPAATMIRWLNESNATVVSLDVPSGIDATTGERLGVAVDADTVLTLALPKTGLLEWGGPIVLADIGIPRTVYERLGIEYENPFGRRGQVELVE